MLLHTDGNYLGMMENIPPEWVSSLEGALSAVEEGRVKNLVLFGEDLLMYVPFSRLERLMDKLEHLVVFSPFSDGLCAYAHIRVPMDLMGRIEGTFSTLMGKVRAKAFLPNTFNHTDFLRLLLEYLPQGRKRTQPFGGEGFDNQQKGAPIQEQLDNRKEREPEQALREKHSHARGGSNLPHVGCDYGSLYALLVYAYQVP